MDVEPRLGALIMTAIAALALFLIFVGLAKALGGKK